MRKKTVFGTYEWAVLNANFIAGCHHDCKYCYSKEMAIRFKRKQPQTWKDEEIDLKRFSREFGKVEGTIMFPSSHDITPQNLEYALTFINKLLFPGNNILIVTKPHLECVKSICNNFRNFKVNILFRFSIGSNNSETLLFWEPNAPSFEERFESLRFAYNEGFKTSVSSEPFLDNSIPDLIQAIDPFVTDSIWVGKANFLKRRLKVNGITDTKSIEMADRLIESQNVEKIKDLFNILNENPKVKWKESIKKVLNINISTEKGLDQ